MHILQNKKRNTGKSSHGRRYDKEVKKFAITLHYHSPKAYDFCRYVCLFLSFRFMKFYSTILVNNCTLFLKIKLMLIEC